MCNEERETGRYTLIIPGYTFDKAAGEKEAKDIETAALMQGRVEYQDHSIDNPDASTRDLAVPCSLPHMGV
jgi:hypothetical protein